MQDDLWLLICQKSHSVSSVASIDLIQMIWKWSYWMVAVAVSAQWQGQSVKLLPKLTIWHIQHLCEWSILQQYSTYLLLPQIRQMPMKVLILQQLVNYIMSLKVEEVGWRCNLKHASSMRTSGRNREDTLQVSKLVRSESWQWTDSMCP